MFVLETKETHTHTVFSFGESAGEFTVSLFFSFKAHLTDIIILNSLLYAFQMFFIDINQFLKVEQISVSTYQQ
jgi:hypothetical protein